MAFVPNPLVVRVVHRLDRAGNPIINVVYHELDSAHTGPVLASVATILGTLYTNTILEQLSNTVNYEECIVYSMSSESAPTGAWSAPDPSPGGIASEATARGASAVITLRTENRGRSGRGRTYLGGISEGSTTNGVLDVGYAGSLETAYSNYVSGAAAEDYNQVVYSQFTAGAPRTTGLSQLVTSIELRSPILGSQRRRNHRP